MTINGSRSSADKAAAAGQKPGTPEQPEDLQALLQQFKGQLRVWLPPLAVAVALALGVTVYRGCRASQAAQASQMLGQARSVQHLQEVVNRFPGSPAAPVALLGVAKSQYDAGDYVLASSTYTDFLKRYPRHPLAPVAELGRLHCLEAMGQTEAALQGFTGFATNRADHFLAPLAQLARARCLEQLRQHEDARVIYEDFLATYTNSPWRAEVEEALSQLRREMRRPAVQL